MQHSNFHNIFLPPLRLNTSSHYTGYNYSVCIHVCICVCSVWVSGWVGGWVMCVCFCESMLLLQWPTAKTQWEQPSPNPAMQSQLLATIFPSDSSKGFNKVFHESLWMIDLKTKSMSKIPFLYPYYGLVMAMTFFGPSLWWAWCLVYFVQLVDHVSDGVYHCF